MSFPRIRVYTAFLITIAVFLFLIFASFIIASKVIVPKKISAYIEEVFKNKGYDIDIEDVEFNIPSGVTVNEIKIFDLKNSRDLLISIKKIDVKPDIPHFLLNRKIKLRVIKVDEPSFTATKDGFERLVRLVKEKEGIANGKRVELSQIEVEHIEITNAEIRLPSGLSLSSKKFLVDFVDAVSKEDKALNLSGLINLQKSEIEVEGRINPFLDEPIGEIRLRANELNTESFFKGLEVTENVDVAATLSFKISDSIGSRGEVDIIPTSDNGKEGRPPFGKVEYDLAFDKKTETAFINSLSLNIFDIIRLSFAGTVEKPLGEGIFNLEGSGKNIRLEKLEEMSERFPTFSRFNFSGGIEPNDIKITGSIKNKDITLSGKVALNEASIKDYKYGFRFDHLQGVFDFKKPFYDDPSGFSAQGNVSFEKASSKKLNINNVSGRIELTSTGKDIMLKSDRLNWKNFSMSGVKSGKGKLKKLGFSLGENKNWDLNMSSSGGELLVFDEGIYFKQFQADIKKNRDGNSRIMGNVIGRDVSYMGISLPNIQADLNLSDSSLQLTNVKMKVKNFGEIAAKGISVGLRKEEGFPYSVELSQGSFTGFDNKIQSKGIGGKFIFYIDKKKTRWSGNLNISESNLYKSRLTNLSFKIKPSSDGMSLESISARFLGGNLKGNALIKSVNSNNLITSEIEFTNGLIPLGKSTLSLGRVSFDYKGELGRSPLPQGSGTFRLSDLKVGKDYSAFPVNGYMQFKTTGETFMIENGFIEDKGRARIPFSARMDNALNTDRRLHINLPNIHLELVRKILVPILPRAISSGNFKGSASLSLTSNHFLQEEGSFIGTLSIKDASFVGKLNDHYFYVNGINGAISLKDKIKPENTLASLMGDRLKLDKRRVFRGFIDAVTPDYLNKEGDFLTIREVEYGFLRLEDIECEVELNKSELNLKRFESALYEGKMFGTGSSGYDGVNPKYSISLVFKNISLKSITDSIPPIKDYITGRINGIIWITGEGTRLGSLNGPFRFWDIDSKDENRRIGKAFLKYLGAKEKFFFGTSHKYDNAELDGYIKDGVITFKELDVSHTVFGVKTLSIRVDERRNSISAAHFLSVIREMAKRAGAGKVKIELRN